MKAFLVMIGLVLSISARAEIRTASLLQIEEYRDSSGALSLFIRPTTNFARSYMELDAKVGISPATLDHPTKDLWVYTPTSAGHRTITLQIFLVDAKQSDRLNESLQAVDEEIEALRAAIADSSDPEEIAALNQALTKKLELKIRLEAELKALKNPIGRETYSFQSFN